MRKSLWSIPVLLLFIAVAAPNAHANTLYAATFTCQAPCGSLPTAPNVLFPAPATIDVTYDLTPFSITLALGDKPTDTYDWMAYESSGVPVDFEIVDTTTGDMESMGVMSKSPVQSDEGTLTFTTPEPSSVGLMLIGIGLLGLMLMRKRIPLGQPHAN
jgi:hypothetical protein